MQRRRMFRLVATIYTITKMLSLSLSMRTYIYVCIEGDIYIIYTYAHIYIIYTHIYVRVCNCNKGFISSMKKYRIAKLISILYIFL